ncbi:hypothetical protein WME97_03185 [Sorangium sp. So ce367]|uniref:hypothetical protein n=1 Tax=Sorangium sp. So ce367 TaxID=3133305 RepID=UPI003F632FB7
MNVVVVVVVVVVVDGTAVNVNVTRKSPLSFVDQGFLHNVHVNDRAVDDHDHDHDHVHDALLPLSMDRLRYAPCATSSQRITSVSPRAARPLTMARAFE